MSYVSQTSRSLNIRFQEHIRYIRYNNPQSAYALHILQNHIYIIYPIPPPRKKTHSAAEPRRNQPPVPTVINPNPRIPHEQVSSASGCIRIPHHNSHTATEHQHTSNQVCGSAHTIFRRHYHNMLHKTVNHYKTPWQPILAKHTL